MLIERNKDFSRPAVLEFLEGRTLCSASDPYPVRDGSLSGSFTSRIPQTSSVGDGLDLKLKIQNTTNTLREGSVDLTFVLFPFVDASTAPEAELGDPVIASLDNMQLSLKPHASTIFKTKGTIPENLDYGSYWVAAAVNPGGSVAAGADYGPTVGATVTFVGYSKVDLTTFKVTGKKASDGSNAAFVNGVFTNSGLSAADGTVTLNFYAAQSTNVSDADILITQKSVDLDVKARKKKSFKFEIDSPTGGTVPAGTYYLRVEIDRSNLAVDVGQQTTANKFSSKPIALGR